MLIEHAKYELEQAGLFDADSDYAGEVGKAVMEIVEVFAKQGHSGFSANLVLSVAFDLLQFKPLTPLTNNPDEWFGVSEMSGKPMWQSKRQPTCFSTDGGQTWYDLNQSQSSERGLEDD